jgi:hypothetical protein
MKTKVLKRFRTGLITIGRESGEPSPPFIGAGWRAVLASHQDRPSLRSQGKEIVICARSWTAAQRALDLIRGSLRVLQGGPELFAIHLIAHNSLEPTWMREDHREALRKDSYSTSHFPWACALAAKASRGRKWIYAITKYAFSISQYSAHHADLEPWRSPYLPVSSFPSDHVLFSHAIISAYAAIEDLGLQVRASTQKPSRINGQWNPAVRLDLEARLSQAGINLTETILWTARGPKRKIERARAVESVRKAPWSAWTVRDLEVEVVDAIAHADWLRSCVASHGTKDLTRVLSPYDVVSVQGLARRLILESLGFWR